MHDAVVLKKTNEFECPGSLKNLCHYVNSKKARQEQVTKWTQSNLTQVYIKTKTTTRHVRHTWANQPAGGSSVCSDYDRRHNLIPVTRCCRRWRRWWILSTPSCHSTRTSTLFCAYFTKSSTYIVTGEQWQHKRWVLMVCELIFFLISAIDVYSYDVTRADSRHDCAHSYYWHNTTFLLTIVTIASISQNSFAMQLFLVNSCRWCGSRLWTHKWLLQH